MAELNRCKTDYESKVSELRLTDDYNEQIAKARYDFKIEELNRELINLEKARIEF